MRLLHRGIYRVCRGIAVLTAAGLLAGCAHTLEVKNLDLYKPAFVNSQRGNIRIALVGLTHSPEEERFLMATANALKRDGFGVAYPFNIMDTDPARIDYIVKVTTSSDYQGSGWNFLINWPGFLIWAPAWHGYNYRAVYGFDVDITDAKTSKSLPHISSPVDLDIRHAAMNRT